MDNETANLTAFEPLYGAGWKVRNRKLRHPLKDSTDWLEFEADFEMRPTLGGLGNVDTFSVADWPDGGSFASGLTASPGGVRAPLPGAGRGCHRGGDGARVGCDGGARDEDRRRAAHPGRRGQFRHVRGPVEIAAAEDAAAERSIGQPG